MSKQNLERNKNISIRVTDEEYEFIKKEMEHYGTKNLSHFMRTVAIRAFLNDAPMIEQDEDIEEKIYKELNAIGRNINQIAKRVNSTDRMYETELNEMLEEIDKMWEYLKSRKNKSSD